LAGTIEHIPLTQTSLTITSSEQSGQFTKAYHSQLSLNMLEGTKTWAPLLHYPN